MKDQIKNSIKDNYSNHYNRLCNVSRFYDDVNYDYVRKHLPSDPGAEILDVGCGQGQLLFWLYKIGFRNLCGVESSEGQIAIAREKLPEAVKLIKCDAGEFIKLKKDCYDVIFLFDVIEHFKKDQMLEFVGEIHSAMRKGGVILIRTPNMANPLGIYSRYIDITHENGFTEYSLAQVLEGVGFMDIEMMPAIPGKLKLRILRSIYQFVLKIIFKLELRSIPTVLDSNITAYARK